MGAEVFMVAVVVLVFFAVFDLIVGVSNDAVNFLNSSIGSRVAPRTVIMIIASLGILAGVTFSSGMMEVARKGIFHPSFFTMPELMAIFLGVMITDVLLLDMFNSFGLPTSTTVSIVFELLGGAVAVSIMKIVQAHDSILALGHYINTAKAMLIIFGILLSVVVAFLSGAIVQFFSRLLFTYDFMPRLKKFGAVWGGIGLATICYFILVKGSKGASFMSADMVAYIKTHTLTILFYSFIGSAVFLQILMFFKINILKPIILIGTFALAMAFAANDLVNFIGVPMAGWHAFKAALASQNPLTVSMGMLAKKVPSETGLLLVAGAVMVVTLWVSKKARTVTETSISLGQQEEGPELFGSSAPSRAIVKAWLWVYDAARFVIPSGIRSAAAARMDQARYADSEGVDSEQRFDMIRAAVNLIVASALISLATSYKLPLSTTYVTFMVAMGASFADQAWGRESAVYRITGVLTVIGGWFLTALSAFTICFVFALIIFLTGLKIGVPVLLAVVLLSVFKNHRKHKEKAELINAGKVYNLKKISDLDDSVETSFAQMSALLKEIRKSLHNTAEGLFLENATILSFEAKKSRQVQNWANIVIANIFKSLRLMQAQSEDTAYRYAEVIHCLQMILDRYRDTVIRAKSHVGNHHKGLLDSQVQDLKEVTGLVGEILTDSAGAFGEKDVASCTAIKEKDERLHALSEELNNAQLGRIVDHSSKTRLSILFYAVIDNALTISKQNIKLLKICEKSFG